MAGQRLISARMTEIDPATGSGITESGLFRAVQPMDAPLWFDGRNVIFRDGGPQKILGWINPFSISTPGIIRGMDSLQDESAVQRLFSGDQANLYAWDGSTNTTLGTGYTGVENESGTTPATTWSYARFGNWMIATNGVDPAQIWKATGSFAALANTSFTQAQIVLRRGPHILVFNTSNGQAWYEWCDADNPETWTPTSTNAAGNQNIRDMDGGIISAVNFGQNIAVLAKNQLFIITYTGAPFYFPYQPALSGIGAVSKASVVQADQLLYGMSRQGFWATDSVSYQYIDTLALRDYVNSLIDTSNLTKVTATYDAYNQQVIWSLPTAGTGENTFSVAYRTINKSWSIFDWARSSWVPQMGVFQTPFSSDVSGNILQHNTGHDAAGVAIDAFVQSKPLDNGDTQSFKYVTDAMLQMRRLTGTARLRIGGQINLTDAIAWSPYITLDASFGQINQRSSGRFISVEVSSAALGADWAMSGFDLFGSTGGSV